MIESVLPTTIKGSPSGNRQNKTFSITEFMPNVLKFKSLQSLFKVETQKVDRDEMITFPRGVQSIKINVALIKPAVKCHRNSLATLHLKQLRCHVKDLELQNLPFDFCQYGFNLIPASTCEELCPYTLRK